MKFTLLSHSSQPKQHYWCLDVGGERLYTSSFFSSFLDALRDLEVFRIGLSSLPVVSEDGSVILSPKNPLAQHHLRLRVTMNANSLWQWEICTDNGLLLDTFGSFNSPTDAANDVTAFVLNIYFDAVVVDQYGSEPPLLSFSRKYRDTFGLVDEHPSANYRN